MIHTQNYGGTECYLRTSETNELRNLHLVFCGILEKIR